MQELLEASRTLKTFAERGRVVPEFREPSIRELIVRRYRLIYEVGPEHIVVFAVIHGSRDLTRALKGRIT